MTLAVSAVSLMAGPVKTCARLDVCLLKTPLNPCGTMLGHGSDSELSENTRLRAVIVRSTIRSPRPSQRMSKFDRLMSIAVETEQRGWVERSDTHQLHLKEMMGFTVGGSW